MLQMLDFYLPEQRRFLKLCEICGRVLTIAPRFPQSEMLETVMIRCGFVSGLLLAFAVASSSCSAQQKVTFDDHIKPIFRAHCQSCHNTNKKSSDLDLSTYTTVMQGGASGASIEPGDAENSYLYMLVAHTSEPYMPPESDRIPDAKVDLLKQWIDAGAPETASSRVTLKKKNNISMNVEISAGARPEGPAPLPDVLGLEPVVHTSTTTAISAIATNPWSKLVAVAGEKQVVLYHSETMEALGVLAFPEGRARVLRFSRNGGLLLAGGGRGGANGLCVVWDVRTGERVMSIGEELDEVLAADISADHSMVALGGPLRMLRVYSTATGELLYESKKHTDWIYSVQFSPDGVLLASSDRSGGLLVWEAMTGREYLVLNGHTGAVHAVSWRIDSNVLASASEDTTVRLWEMENGGQIKNWNAHGGGTFAVEYTRDGRLVTSGRDKVVKIWDGNGGQLRAFDAFADLALQASHCDETDRVIGGDWTGEIRVWAAADGQLAGHLSPNPPPLQARLDQAQGLVPPAAEKLRTAETAQQNAAAAVTAQQKTNEEYVKAMQLAEKQLSDRRVQMAETQKKLTAQQEAQKVVVARMTALQKAVPELKTAAEKSGQALALTAEDKELAQIVELLKGQVAAREAELKGRTEESAAMQKSVDEMTAMVAALTKQVTADEEALAAAVKQVETGNAALIPVQEALAAADTVLAAARAEHTAAVSQVDRWQNYIELTGELAVLDQARQARDQAELASLEATAVLEEKQQELAQVVAAIESAKAQQLELTQKSDGVKQSMAAGQAQVAARTAAVAQSEKAVPVLVASLEQANGALKLLPEDAELKQSVQTLAVVLDRQQKQIPAEKQEIVKLNEQVAAMKTEMDGLQKSLAEMQTAMQTSTKQMQEIQAGMGALETQAREMSERFAAAASAVDAASGTVESRRERLRPLLQLSAVR